jgi:glycerol kinase
VTFVPAFAGLGTPHWDPHARGLIVGITRGTTREHLARAALEAIAFSVTELLEAFADVLPEPIAELRADGGAARNDLLLQLQADLAGVPVVRPAETETTALGAAFLAGLGHGMFASLEDLAELWHAERVFEPRMSADERSEHLARWRRAVERSRGWAAPA